MKVPSISYLIRIFTFTLFILIFSLGNAAYAQVINNVLIDIDVADSDLQVRQNFELNNTSENTVSEIELHAELTSGQKIEEVRAFGKPCQLSSFPLGKTVAIIFDEPILAGETKKLLLEYEVINAIQADNQKGKEKDYRLDCPLLFSMDHNTSQKLNAVEISVTLPDNFQTRVVLPKMQRSYLRSSDGRRVIEMNTTNIPSHAVIEYSEDSRSLTPTNIAYISYPIIIIAISLLIFRELRRE